MSSAPPTQHPINWPLVLPLPTCTALLVLRLNFLFPPNNLSAAFLLMPVGRTLYCQGEVQVFRPKNRNGFPTYHLCSRTVILGWYLGMMGFPGQMAPREHLGSQGAAWSESAVDSGGSPCDSAVLSLIHVAPGELRCSAEHAVSLCVVGPRVKVLCAGNGSHSESGKVEDTPPPSTLCTDSVVGGSI